MSRKFKIQTSNYWVLINTFLFILAIALLNLGFSPTYAMLPILAIPVVLAGSILFIKVKSPVLYLVFALFNTVYISLPLILLNFIQLESLQMEIPFALAIFIVIWTNDTFAYLGGISFGKHKMLKRVSPLKSWEGFLGGLIMVIPVLLIFYHFFPSFGIVNWIIFGLLTVIFGVTGDFLESLIKRGADIKDSGNLLPGHGGILDRIDSVLIAIPVIFIYLQIALSI
jgi:phosphatidate cytidylyltransferase